MLGRAAGLDNSSDPEHLCTRKDPGSWQPRRWIWSRARRTHLRTSVPLRYKAASKHKIVDVGSGEAETVPQPRIESEETPEEKLGWWKVKIFGSADPFLLWLTVKG
jgi:hypothetical protein